MSEEHFAVSRISPAPAAQSDYDSICAALMQTERGRWFLQEYAKRNRSADTQLLLAAIQRIETVVCADRNERGRQARRGFRSDLLEMAKAITRTRAEVAEIRSDAALRPELAEPDGQAPPPRPRDVFAAAERIRDVTWAMRGHGFEPSTCDQLEELAASILSASALRDPTDRRASKLSEVLQYLEHRIETLLEGSADGEPSEPPPESQAVEPAPAIGFAGNSAIAESERAAADLEADAAALAAATDLPTIDAQSDPPPGEPEPPISAQIQEVEAQSAEPTSRSEPSPADGVQPTSASADEAPTDALAAPGRDLAELAVDGGAAAPSAPAPEDLAAASAEPPSAAPAAAVRSETKPAPAAEDGSRLPAVELAYSIPLLPSSSNFLAAAAVLRGLAADAHLPELDMRAGMPGIAAARAGGLLAAMAASPQALAAGPELAQLPIAFTADFDDARALGQPEPIGLDPAPVAEDQLPSPASPPPAAAEPMPAAAAPVTESHTAPLPAAATPAQAAPMPQPPQSDPLADLKAMSAEELIALFS